MTNPPTKRGHPADGDEESGSSFPSAKRPRHHHVTFSDSATREFERGASELNTSMGHAEGFLDFEAFDERHPGDDDSSSSSSDESDLPPYDEAAMEAADKRDEIARAKQKSMKASGISAPVLKDPISDSCWGVLHAGMKKLKLSMEMTIEGLITHLSIADEEASALNWEHTYPIKLVALLCTILGCPEHLYRDRARPFFSYTVQKRITIRALLRSLLAAATMKWCLQSNFNGWSSSPLGVSDAGLQQLVDQYVPEHSRAAFHQSLKVTFVDENIMPTVEARAWDMAFTFDSFLQHIIPARTPKNDWDGMVEGLTQAIGADTRAPDFTYESYQHWQPRWLRALQDTFRSALRLRADLEKINDGVARFEFPEFDAALFLHKDMAPSKLGEFAGDKKARILLTLLPTATRRKVSRREGEKGTDKFKVVLPGNSIVVDLWDEDNKTSSPEGREEQDAA